MMFAACGDPAQVLEGYTDSKVFTDDDQDYAYYTYDDSADPAFEKDENYKEVTADNLEDIKGYFTDFYEWAKLSSFSGEYKADEAMLTAGDRYVIADQLVDDSGSGIRKLTTIYRKYDLYYYDKESHTLHRIHNDLTVK